MEAHSEVERVSLWFVKGVHAWGVGKGLGRVGSFPM